MIRPYLKAALLGLSCGVVGVLLTLGVVHVYADHQAFHAIINMINANAAKQAPPVQ